MTKTHSYEVVRRESNQHRPGHFALLIDGMDCDVTCDPGLFLGSSLAEAIREGLLPGAGAEARADELSQAKARFAMQRKADRIRLGRVGGKAGVAVGRADRLNPKLTEEKAIEAYLNRGKLKGLNKTQREELFKRRLERRVDNSADWIARRAKQVERCQVEIAQWEAELAKGNPKAEKRLVNLRELLRNLTPDVVAASHGFQYAFGQYLLAQVDIDTADIRFVLCMTSTDADTVQDAVDACSDLALDEFDGSSYTTGGVTLASVAVNIDDANNRAEVDCTDPTPVSYGAGTRALEGILVIKWITNLNSSLPLHFLDFSSNPTPDGNPFSITINAEGFLQVSG